jgi:hypothetical protein
METNPILNQLSHMRNERQRLEVEYVSTKLTSNAISRTILNNNQCTEINCVLFLLAYFPKMKVGLSNRLPVCVCVYVSPPLITFEPIGGFS